MVQLLGEPNESGVDEDLDVKAKYYRWFDYGIEAITLPGHSGYVSLIFIYAKETVETSMHASVGIYLGKDKIENAAPFEKILKYGRHYVCIRSLDKNQSLKCKKGEIAMLYISFITDKKAR